MKRKTSPYPHFAYLVFDGAHHCKIGISRNPKMRLRQLQTANPRKLEIKKTWHFPFKWQAYLLEQLSLLLLATHHSSGEWLEVPPDKIEGWVEALYFKIKNRHSIELNTPLFQAQKELRRHNLGAL